MGYGGRVYSTTGNPLALSVFLAMVIPFNLSLIGWLWRKHHTRRTQVLLAGLCLLLVLQFWCLWLAQYSLTILLFLISSIAFVVLLGIVNRYKVILIAGVACVLAIVTIAAMLLIPAISSGVTPHAVDIDEAAETTAADEVGLTTLSWRVEYWKAAWDVIADPPDVPFSNDHLRFMRPLVGYGPETFVVTMQQTYPGQTQDRIPLFFKLSRPHNHYLYLATTIGVLGLMAFLAILAVFFYMCFRHVFRMRSELDRLLLIGAMASMTGFLADCLFNPETITGNLVFWLSLSVVPALIKPERSESNCPGEMEITIRHSSSGSDGTRRYLAPVFILLLMAIAAGITASPFLADMYYQEGLNLNARGSPEAVSILEKAVELQPSETTYLGAIGMYYYRAARLTDDDSQASKYLALSTDYYQRAREAEPLVAYHYHILADVYAYWAVQGDVEKWTEAMTLYDQALQLFPNNALIANKWVLALIASGDLREARVKLQRAVDIDSSWIGNLMCGLILMEQGDDSVQEIINNMDVHKMNPRDLVYFVSLCRYIYASGLLPEFDRGVESYSEQVPNVWLSHAMLAVTSLLTTDNDRGFEEFKTAIELAPDDSILYLRVLIQDLSRLDARLNTLLTDDTSSTP